MRVFKYRGGDEEIFRRDLFSIEKNYFWGPNFNQLNDPCETLILSDKFKSLTKGFTKFLNQKSQTELDKVHVALDNLINRRKEIGIYSLSQTYNDELLWAHYADSHKGFCIEYDLNILLESYPTDKVYYFPIKYSKNPPEVGISDLFDKEGISIIKKLAGNKSKKWEYEKEFRIIIDKCGEHFYNFQAVKAIYFGLRMPEEWKEIMINTLKGRGIKYYQIIQVKGQYFFEREPLPDIHGQKITYLCQITSPNGFNVGYRIIEKDFNKFTGKATITIQLETKLDYGDLTNISKTIKSEVFRNAKIIFLSFIVERIPVDHDYWAVARVDGEDIAITILGQPIDQENLLIDNNEKRLSVNKSKIKIFNDVGRLRTELSKNGIGTLRRWRVDQSGWISSTDYYSFGKESCENALQNNLAYYLESNMEFYVQKLKIILTLNNVHEKKTGLDQFKKLVQKTFKSISSQLPDGLLNSISGEKEFELKNEYFSIELKLNRSNINTWKLVIEPKLNK